MEASSAPLMFLLLLQSATSFKENRQLTKVLLSGHVVQQTPTLMQSLHETLW